VDLLAPLHRDACKVQAFLAPLILVRERISDHARKTYSFQPAVGFFRMFGIFRNQKELLIWINDKRRPTGEVPHETNLNGSADVQLGKLFRGPGIQNECAPAHLLNQLSDGYEPKCKGSRQLESPLRIMAQPSGRFDHFLSKRSTLWRSASLSGVAAPRLCHSFQTSALF